ncbi:MAG TPA: pseudouridylate synthase, partial [Rikenellaceae bacterium]|nr:pseudouridylate synthase [Rikenellaceae bacterium]
MTEDDLKTFDFTSVDIKDLLPQQEPFVMISSLLSCSYQRTVTRFLIQKDNVFVEDGKLVSEGLVENIAQTCAARIGFINKYLLHKPVSVGYVCALKDFKVFGTPSVGETIETEINLKGEFGTMLMVDA